MEVTGQYYDSLKRHSLKIDQLEDQNIDIEDNDAQSAYGQSIIASNIRLIRMLYKVLDIITTEILEM